jgi:hypothetical protein
MARHKDHEESSGGGKSPGTPTHKSEAEAPGGMGGEALNDTTQPLPSNEPPKYTTPTKDPAKSAQKAEEEENARVSKARMKSLEDFSHRAAALANAAKTISETTGCTPSEAVAAAKELYMEHCCHGGKQKSGEGSNAEGGR